MKFPTPTAEQIAALDSDCPECEICCAVGLCCPPAQQFVRLVGMFHKATGSDLEECAKYARVIVEARLKAQEKHA